MALISSTTCCAGVWSPPLPSAAPPRSLTTTLAPSAANSSACSRPMPRPAPVMMATRPSSAPMRAHYGLRLPTREERDARALLMCLARWWVGEQHRIARAARDADDGEPGRLEGRRRLGDGLVAHVGNRDRLRALREDHLHLRVARHFGARRRIGSDDLARGDGV